MAMSVVTRVLAVAVVASPECRIELAEQRANRR
jgi:hypothetical protein